MSTFQQQQNYEAGKETNIANPRGVGGGRIEQKQSWGSTNIGFTRQNFKSTLLNILKKLKDMTK